MLALSQGTSEWTRGTGAYHDLSIHISCSCIHDFRNFNKETLCTDFHTNMTSTVEDNSAVEVTLYSIGRPTHTTLICCHLVMGRPLPLSFGGNNKRTVSSS